MVDKIRRRKYAQLLRRFFAGRITNRQYESRMDQLITLPERGMDAALWAIQNEVWPTYDDILTHKMSGRYALTAEGRSKLARVLMFLYTDCEYSWPRRFSRYPWFDILLNLLTAGTWVKQADRNRRRQLATVGDPNVWPFLTEQEYSEALRRPALLYRLSSGP